MDEPIFGVLVATKKLLQDPQKRRAWVIYQLSLEGRSLAAVARDAGVSRHCLYHVFRHSYPRMERIVANAMNLFPQDLFPDRYTADGHTARCMERPGKGNVTTERRATAPSNERDAAPGEE